LLILSVQIDLRRGFIGDRNITKSGLIITSAICQIVTHYFSLRHHSATPTWRNLKECGTLQPKFKMAETMINPAK